MKAADLHQRFSQLIEEMTYRAQDPNETFYDHENDFYNAWIELGKQAYELSLGKKEVDRRKKKSSTQSLVK